MAKKKKYKQGYTTGGRVDMRNGGRISLQEGGIPGEDYYKDMFKDGRFGDNYNVGDNSPASNTPQNELTEAQSEREQRVVDTGQRAVGIATGQVTLEDLGAAAEPVKAGARQPGETEAEFRKRQEAETVTGEGAKMAKPEDIKPGQVIVKDTDRERELAAQQKATVATVPSEAEIEAAKIKSVEAVDEKAIVKAAEGKVDPKVSKILADAAGIGEVPEIEGAEVEIEPGALTERVVGVLSPDAKATAAQNAGVTLAKVTRAKKQLANAGLSEEEINALGTDPEDLEARLMDFSEEQRGIIEGLPEEALVSTQLDSLLAGIEEGEIPVWARPAVASVEQMLAKRGLRASSIGRDALVNTIIQSSIPLAQANAQAIQASVAQQKTIEAQAAEADTQRRQQTATDNANKVFQMDMAQFTSDQQIALSNSKFLQTVSLTEAGYDQQAILQQSSLMAQRNLAEADQNTKLGIQNAQAFMNMDMANLSNEQQSSVLKAQLEQQRMLTNAGAENARRQFNATSDNQVNQFMSQLFTNVELNNSQRNDAMKQFNVTQANQAFAQQYQTQAELDRFNSQLESQILQFNAQQDFARDQFNAQNSLLIEQSNVQWRRQTTTADTAVQNQINMQNAQNTFAMTQTAQAQLWQELRDEFDYIFKASENAENRKTNIAVAGMQGGDGAAYKNSSWLSALKSIMDLV
jgi:hypothetical protein